MIDPTTAERIRAAARTPPAERARIVARLHLADAIHARLHASWDASTRKPPAAPAAGPRHVQETSP